MQKRKLIFLLLLFVIACNIREAIRSNSQFFLKVTLESGKLEELCCCLAPNCNKPKYMANNEQPMGTLPPGFSTDNSHSNMMYIGEHSSFSDS